MAYPILKPEDGWSKSADYTYDKATITSIEIKDSYTPTEADTVTASWDASQAQDKSITVYLINDTKIVIAGNGSGKIALNPTSTNLFLNFKNIEALTGLEIFDATNLEIIEQGFGNLQKLKSIDLSGWRTPKLKDMVSLFGWPMFGDKTNSSLEIINLSNWDLSHIEWGFQCFAGCVNLKQIIMENVIPLHIQLYGGNPLNPNMPSDNLMLMFPIGGMFAHCEKLEKIDVSNWNVDNVQSMKWLFSNCHSLKSLDLSNWNVSNLKSINAMFQSCSSLVNLKLPDLSVNNIDNMAFSFYGCTSLKTVDVSKWNTSKVTTFDHMFAHSQMSGLDTTHWNTSACKNFNALFHNTRDAVIDVSNFDTSNGEVFAQMFESNPNLEKIIGLENLNTSKGIAFEDMFYNLPKLKELNLSNFDTTKAKDGVKVSANESTSTTMENFIGGTTHPDKIILGKNFSYNGDGTTTDPTHHAVLYTPSTTDNPNADGKWYSIDGNMFTPEEALAAKDNTYFNNKTVRDNLPVIVKNKDIIEVAKAIREKNSLTTKYSLAEMATAIRALNITK